MAAEGNGREAEGSAQPRRHGRSVTDSLSRKLRATRLERGLSLKAVAEKAQISTSLLSQIERGKASPSLVSLVAIADALTIRPGALLDAGDEAGVVSPVVRQADRHVVDDPECRREYMMHIDDPTLEVCELQIRPGAATRPLLAKHSGRDYGIVLEGRVIIEFDSDEEELCEGDYIAFDADRPHRLVNRGEDDARVIWIIAHDSRTRPAGHLTAQNAVEVPI